MYAGLPTVSLAVQGNVANRLGGTLGYLSEVIHAFELAFQAELTRKIENEILSPFGIDRATFLRRGRAWFGDDHFGRLLYQINAEKLETEFLVAGFEPHGQAHVFSVHDPGVSVIHDAVGFYAIGAGQTMALGSLFAAYDADLKVNEMVYRICEAKFAGESALGVGKKTFLEMMTPDGRCKALRPEQVERLRPVWEQEKRPPPSKAIEIIDAELHEIVWHPEGSTKAKSA